MPIRIATKAICITKLSPIKYVALGLNMQINRVAFFLPFVKSYSFVLRPKSRTADYNCCTSVCACVKSDNAKPEVLSQFPGVNEQTSVVNSKFGRRPKLRRVPNFRLNAALESSFSIHTFHLIRRLLINGQSLYSEIFYVKLLPLVCTFK